MKKTVKFFGILTLIIIVCTCSSKEIKLDKSLNEEAQAKIDSAYVKILAYAFTDVVKEPVKSIVLKSSGKTKVRLVNQHDGKLRLIKYQVRRRKTDYTLIELNRRYLDLAMPFLGQPENYPEIEIFDRDSVYNIIIWTCHWSEYKMEEKIEVIFDKNGNIIEPLASN